MDELEELEGLLNELLQGLQQVFQSGEVLSDEIQGEIAVTLERLVNRIDLLKSESDEVPTISLLEQAQMPSSNVNAYQYDPKSKRLFVQFLDKYPDPNGPIYAYENVQPGIFDIIRKGAVPAKTKGQNRWGSWWVGKMPSLGAAVNALLVKGGYPYQRVS